MSEWLTPETCMSFAFATVAAVLTVEVILFTRWSTLICKLLEGIKRTLIALYDGDLSDEQREVALRNAALTMLAVSFKALCIIAMIATSFWIDEIEILKASYRVAPHGAGVTYPSMSLLLLYKSFFLYLIGCYV